MPQLLRPLIGVSLITALTLTGYLLLQADPLLATPLAAAYLATGLFNVAAALCRARPPAFLNQLALNLSVALLLAWQTLPELALLPALLAWLTWAVHYIWSLE